MSVYKHTFYTIIKLLSMVGTVLCLAGIAGSWIVNEPLTNGLSKRTQPCSKPMFQSGLTWHLLSSAWYLSGSFLLSCAFSFTAGISTYLFKSHYICDGFI